MREVLWKIDRALRMLESCILAVGIISTTFIIFINVVLRYMFSAPLSWAEELSRYIMIWLTFIGASLCVRDNVHVNMDILQTRLPFPAAKVLVCIVDLIAAGACLYFGSLGIRLTTIIKTTHQISTTMPMLPMWIVNLCVPLFGFLLAKNYIHLFVLNLMRKGEIITTIAKGGQS